MTTNARDEKWSEWIEWNGGECPLKNNEEHQVRFRNAPDSEIVFKPENWCWTYGIGEPSVDIIAYRYKIKEPESDGGWTPEAIKAAAFSTPDEEEAWQAKEERQKRSKYHVQIRPGVWVDCYDVLHAFGVTNPGDQHAIKKMLMPGKRGHKDAIQDRREAIQSLERAIELEEGQ